MIVAPKLVISSLILVVGICQAAVAGPLQDPPRPAHGQPRPLLPTTKIPAPQDAAPPSAVIDMSRLFGEEIPDQTPGHQELSGRITAQDSSASSQLPPVVAPQDALRPAIPVRNSRYNIAGQPSSLVHQVPQLRVITASGAPINIYQPANIKFTVVNDGQIAAESVSLAVEIRGNGRVISTTPTAVIQEQAVFYSIGNIGGGESRECLLEFQASDAGQIELLPRVTISSGTKVSLGVSAPKIEIHINGESEFTVGQSIQQRVVIRNSGRETVRKLIISQANTPDGSLENAAFADRQQHIGDLAPGEHAEVAFSAVGTQPGEANLQISVNGENVRGTASRRLRLVESLVSTTISGPETAYVNSLGTYSISVSNDHDRILENVTVKLALPQGMVAKVIDRPAATVANSTLTWTIPQLAAGGSEVIHFKAISSRFGDSKIRVSVNEGTAIVAQSELNTNIVGRADVGIEIRTTPDPLEVGAETEVGIIVENRGTNAAEKVQVEVHIPAGLQPAMIPGVENTGRALRFAPFELGVGQKKVLKVGLKSFTPGDYVIRAEVGSSASSKSISSEGSLFFYESGKTRIADQSELNDR